MNKIIKTMTIRQITANAIYRPNQDDLDAMYSTDYDDEFDTEDWV